MRTFRYIHIFTGLVMISMLASCSDRLSDVVPESKTKGIFVATIAGGGSGDSRVMRSVIDDWSYTRFDNTSDAIGFYSMYGNLDGENNNGQFVNAQMVYTRGEAGNRDEDRYWRGVFGPVDMNYDVGLIKNDVEKTFVYFPYTDRMEFEGMELRQEMPDGSYRCVDALAMSKIAINDAAMMSGSFDHTFSEVVIIRGYGFDDPKPNDGIKVVTTDPYSHAKVVNNENDGHSDWKILKPVYYENYKLDEQACREWEAWDGAPYVDGDKEYPAKYVIIPTAISGDRSTVNYVELYDNNGTLHKVTTFGLMTTDNKRVSPKERYYLTIRLEGLVPTIYPFAIEPWSEETRYTDQRARGINSDNEFMQFVLAYNRYNQNNRRPEDEEALKTYGDKYDVDGDVRWHFHINNDIDLSSLTVENFNIVTLCDTLDGRTNKLHGLKSKKAFITELQAKGCIRNLNITGLNVTNTDSDASSVTGGLIDRMTTGGLIIGCHVDGYVRANGTVGLAVGQFSAGTISNCSFSGLVVGSSSHDDEGLFGEVPPGGLLPEMLKNVDTSGLIVAQN